MTTVCIGIDGGGTKTRALCNQAGSDDISETIAGPCTLAAMSAQEACSTIVSCVDQLNVKHDCVDSLCAAVAGWSFVKRRNELDSALHQAFPNAKISLIPDFEAAFRNAQPNSSGIHIIAGTGSVAYGVNSSTTKSHRAGGYGYLIDDSGSGYGVGRASIASVLRAIDRTGPKTVLGAEIAAHLGLDSASWEQFIEAVYGGGADRVTIASLAEVVGIAARNGDEAAQHILFRAGGALAKLAEAVYFALFDGDPLSVKFTRSGGLWQAGEELSDVFMRSVNRFAPGAAIGSVADVDCARGALEIAQDMV